MLNLGFGEIAIIAALAIVVVGPDRLPEMLRFLGKQYGKVMRASNELRRAFMIEADRDDAQKRAAALRQRREQARKRAEEARKRALERARQLEGDDEALPRDLLHDDPPQSEAHTGGAPLAAGGAEEHAGGAPASSPSADSGAPAPSADDFAPRPPSPPPTDPADTP